MKELRGFLGLTGYYRKFVAGYGKIAYLLTEQLKKDNFGWTYEAEHAFNQLKHAMTTVPILALPDFNKPLVIKTDASGVGVGAVLMQDQRPIAYYSHILPQRNRLKSVYERELMAIVFAIQKWRPYLLLFKKLLKYLLEQRLISEEHQKWLTKLLGYTFDIQYRLGLENRAADALSQYPEFTTLTLSPVMDFEEIQKEVETDEAVNHIRMEVLEGNPKYSDYAIVQGQLLYKGRIVLP